MKATVNHVNELVRVNGKYTLPQEIAKEFDVVGAYDDQNGATTYWFAEGDGDLAALAAAINESLESAVEDLQ